MSQKPLKKCRVLVTPTSYGKNDPSLRVRLEEAVGHVIYNSEGRPLKSPELIEIIPNIDGYIAGLDEIDAGVIEAAETLQVIARYGIGVDAIDLDAARENEVVITNTPGANASSVAELTVGLILSLARQITIGNSLMQSGIWPRLHGVSLVDKVIGILGLGAVGKQLVLRLSSFECTIRAYDPMPDSKFARQHQVEFCDLHNVISQSDFLSLHLPLVPETREMVDATFLAKMKKGSFLINTARGELIDELALAKALEHGHLSGAALDVFTHEPPDKENRLLALPQVITTPHMASHTDIATDTMGHYALRDCLAVLQGKEPKHRVI